MAEQNVFLRFVNGLAGILEKCINFCACILLAVVSLAVVIQVLGRQYNIPVVWLGELSTFAVIWTIFFGLAIGYRHGLFAQVDIICHVTPASWRKYLSILWDIVGLAIMTWILWSCRDYLAHVARRKMLSAELRIPLFYVYLGPVLGYLFTSYFTLANIVNKTAAIVRGDPAATSGDGTVDGTLREMADELGADLTGAPAEGRA